MHPGNPQRSVASHGQALRREALQMAPTANHRSLIVFRVGGQRYAIASCSVQQILPMAELYRPPGAPQVLFGFLDLAGELVPVIRLHHLLEMPEAPLELWTPLVILHGAEGRRALLVESVEQTLMIDEAAVLPLPERRDANGCAEGAIRSGDESILLLSAGRLLLKQENQAIDQWRQRVQQRIHDVEGTPA